MIRQPPIQTRMADNSESTGSVPYEPTPPAFLISAREWAKYEIKVVREDGVVVDTIGARLPMNVIFSASVELRAADIGRR